MRYPHSAFSATYEGKGYCASDLGNNLSSTNAFTLTALISAQGAFPVPNRRLVHSSQLGAAQGELQVFALLPAFEGSGPPAQPRPRLSHIHSAAPAEAGASGERRSRCIQCIPYVKYAECPLHADISACISLFRLQTSLYGG